MCSSLHELRSFEARMRPVHVSQRIAEMPKQDPTLQPLQTACRHPPGRQQPRSVVRRSQILLSLKHVRYKYINPDINTTASFFKVDLVFCQQEQTSRSSSHAGGVAASSPLVSAALATTPCAEGRSERLRSRLFGSGPASGQPLAAAARPRHALAWSVMSTQAGSEDSRFAAAGSESVGPPDFRDLHYVSRQRCRWRVASRCVCTKGLTMGTDEGSCIFRTARASQSAPTRRRRLGDGSRCSRGRASPSKVGRVGCRGRVC